jgi:hypothetical protein
MRDTRRVPLFYVAPLPFDSSTSIGRVAAQWFVAQQLAIGNWQSFIGDESPETAGFDYAGLTNYAILHVNEPISAKVARPAGWRGTRELFTPAKPCQTLPNHARYISADCYIRIGSKAGSQNGTHGATLNCQPNDVVRGDRTQYEMDVLSFWLFCTPKHHRLAAVWLGKRSHGWLAHAATGLASTEIELRRGFFLTGGTAPCSCRMSV